MLIILLIITAIARYADIWTSKRDIYYGGKEANPLWRDEYNHFSVMKNGIASILLLAGLTFISTLTEYGWLGFTPFALGSFIIALLNYQVQRKSRVDQSAFLMKLRHIQEIGGTEQDVEIAFNDRQLITVSDRTWYRGFDWIYETGSIEVVAPILIKRVAALAMLDSPFPK